MKMLDRSQCRTLLDALNSIPILDSTAGRNALLMQLPASLVHQIPRSEVKAIDLVNIVDICNTWEQELAADDPHPLQILIENAQQLVLGSAVAVKLQPLLESIAENKPSARNKASILYSPCPYPGMVPFQSTNAQFFYGRSNEITQIVRHLRYRNFLLIVGPSGSGKTSLVFAGLLPALDRSSYWEPGYWHTVTFRPGPQPVNTLFELLGTDLIQPASTITDFLAKNTSSQRLLLIVDQFEELFTQADTINQYRFIEILEDLRALPTCAIVITLRADFYSNFMESQLWNSVKIRDRLEIGPLRGEALRTAIQQPAYDVGVRLEPGLVERLFADVANEPGCLPLLQETLVLLWDEMVHGVLTLRAYENLGDEERTGVAVALAFKADAALDQLTTEQQSIAQRIFLRLIQFSEGRPHTRRQQSVSALQSHHDNQIMFEQTISKLTANRLLIFSGVEVGADRRVDLAHEALITGWPTLKSWLTEWHEGEQIRRDLEAKAKDWRHRGAGKTGLLDKASLATAMLWMASPAAVTLGYTTAVHELVEASDAELQRQRDLTDSLMSLEQAMLSSLELPQVLDIALSQIPHLIKFDYGMIYMTHPQTNELDLVMTTDNITACDEELALRPGTAAWELWERAQMSGPAVACNAGMCILNIPLRQRDNSLGCIVLMRYSDSPFSQAEYDIAQRVAQTASLAIVNARLFSSRSIQQQQATALYRLMIQASEATSRRALSRVICAEIQKISNARAVALLINDPEQGRFAGWSTSGEWQDNLQVQNVVLSGQGDPFVRNILTGLQQRGVAELLIFPGAPPQWHAVFGDAPCVTIPMTLGRRIYGLLILLPGSGPPIDNESREILNLAISHCTVVLERAELFEQTLGAVRQAGTLNKMATEVQASLDLATVVQTTAASCVSALPIESCEVYILDADRRYLLRSGMDVRPGVEQTGWISGPASIAVRDCPVALEVLHSPDLVSSDFVPAEWTARGDKGSEVVLGRLLGSGEPLGIVRLTTALPAAEFVRRHATFCRTLWMQAGGALERSFLYTTAVNQAALLRRRTRYLTDILDLDNLSSADVPVSTLLPQLATSIARSLGFGNVQIGVIGESGAVEWHLGGGVIEAFEPLSSQPPVSLAAIEQLLASGETPRQAFKGVYVDEALLAQVRPEYRPPAVPASAVLILVPLYSSAREALGFLFAGPCTRIHRADTAAEDDLLIVLSIFAHRVARYLESPWIK